MAAAESPVEGNGARGNPAMQDALAGLTDAELHALIAASNGAQPRRAASWCSVGSGRQGGFLLRNFL